MRQYQENNKKQRIASHVASLPKSGIRDFFELVNKMGGDVISLGIGEPDFITPRLIRDRAILSLEEGRTSYTSNLGLISLRTEIARYLSEYYSLNYSPEKECIITVGVSEALDLAIRALTNPGDEIIYHEPCYVSYRSEIVLAHGIPAPIKTSPENNFMPKIEDIEKAISPRTKAILLNFPCNPTGASLDLPTIEKIAAIAKKHDLIVITDEIYSELTYDTEHFSIAALPGMKDRTIFLHGFSKAYAMTGFRMGYACGPFELIDAMMKIHQYSMLCAPTTAQEAAIEALKNGRGEMLKMKDEYRRRRDLIVSSLNEIGLDCVMPKGAFYVFPSIKKTELSSANFAKMFLEKYKVAVVPGPGFGTCGEGFVRCAYTASYENIKEAMARMKKFVAEC
jgi:aminotransferase